MKIYLGSWTTTKAVVAVAGLLAIGGAIGSAVAITPTVSAPVKFQSGWEAQRVDAFGCCLYAIGTVPSGRSLLLTDVVATNTDNAQVLFTVYQGSNSCITHVKDRLSKVGIAPLGSIHLRLETGIGFTAGQELCLAIPSGAGPAHFNFRGFLFTTAPPA